MKKFGWIIPILLILIWGMKENFPPVVEHNPLSFEDVRDILNGKSDDSKKLYRVDEIQDKYNKQKAQYISTLDMIHIKEFGAEEIYSEDSGKYMAKEIKKKENS
jgi:hypothetical protein